MAAAQDICCANCDCTKNVMKRCTGCRQAFYCSRECQRNHWPSHKPECAKGRVLHPNSDLLPPVEKEGFCKVNSENDSKCLAHSNNLASTKICASIDTEEMNRQCGNNTSKCYSYEEEKMLAAISEGISCESNHLEQLASPLVGAGVAAGIKDKTELTGQEVNLTNFSVKIFIKHNKAKHSLCIPISCINNGRSVVQLVSDLLHIPVPKLKLIHKGKMVTPDNIEGFMSEKALFQAFGEVAEPEDDLEKSDIDLIMKQVGVDRNAAIRALRDSGTVIDAIIDLGNK